MLTNAGKLVTRVIARVSDVVGPIAMPPATALPIEASDVQGLVFRGYGGMKSCAYCLLQVKDVARARAWLRALWPNIARGAPASGGSALQIAFTHGGLERLGVRAETLGGFPAEFSAGMVGEHRSRFLGDLDESAPANWAWGGPSNPALHAVLIAYAGDDAKLKQLLDEQRRKLAAGFDEIARLDTKYLGAREHFGFTDSISQPAIEGYHASGTALHRIKAGEFILGYPNEYGLFTRRPLVAARNDALGRLPLDVAGSPRHDFGRNGTYLAMRQLRQHVRLFRDTLASLTRRADGSPNPSAEARLAAQMIGRWPSGASLVESPDADDPGKAEANDFRYHEVDAPGARCPIGSHVRRANPRDSLEPDPGSERSLRVNRRHRLLRRGRTYGPALPVGASDDADRGVIFVGINANLVRQFEFIQHSWIEDQRFNGLSRVADPILGSGRSHEFSVLEAPLPRRYTDLPRFVTVSGGAYLFMPGIRALRYLSELET